MKAARLLLPALVLVFVAALGAGAALAQVINTDDYNPQGANATGSARVFQMHGVVLFNEGVFNDLQTGEHDDAVIGVNQQTQDNRTGTQVIEGTNVFGDVRFKLESVLREGSAQCGQDVDLNSKPCVTRVVRGVLQAANQIQHSIVDNVAANNMNKAEFELVANEFAGVNAVSANEDAIDAEND